MFHSGHNHCSNSHCVTHDLQVELLTQYDGEKGLEGEVRDLMSYGNLSRWQLVLTSRNLQ